MKKCILSLITVLVFGPACYCQTLNQDSVKNAKYMDSLLKDAIKNAPKINTKLAYSLIPRFYIIEYVDTIRKQLGINQVATFLYDKCLDEGDDGAHYYFYVPDDSTNKSSPISLRHDIIENISVRDAKKILALANLSRLKELCNLADSSVPYSNWSTWKLLVMRSKGKLRSTKQ